MIIRPLVCSVLVSFLCHAMPRINLFRPSDRPLLPEKSFQGGGFPWCGGILSVGYEGAFHIRAFRDTDDSELFEVDIKRLSSQEKKADIFALFQDSQSTLAALKGFDSDTSSGQTSQLFILDDEACNQGFFRPRGSLSVPMNLLFSQRFYFSHGLRLEFHLPVIHAELKDVQWCPVHQETTAEQLLATDLITSEQTAGLNLHGWKRTGIGDLVVQAAWMRNFPQRRVFLQDVRVQTRCGVIVPTGKRADEDRLLAFPFGSDGAWGIQFAGGIDLDFGYTLRGGIDAEFVYLFGTTHCRRVKTSSSQTDLLFLQKVPVFREPGLGQQYNIYLESRNLLCNTSFKLNYQFLKQNDDRIDIASDRIDSTAANSAPSLFDWSAHSLLAMVHHDLWRDYESSRIFPSLGAWVKWGFSGKRALLANTVGLQLTIAF